MYAESTANPVLATVRRGQHVESRHRGCLVIVRRGEVVWSAGDPEQLVFCRSATKPFQALPALERGIAARLGLTDQELALMIASHDGTEQHVAGVRSLLAKGGLREQQLGCGPHAPLDRASAQELVRQGTEPGRVHNNCSGKHAGFLHLTQELGGSLPGYLDPEGEAQRLVRRAIAEMAGVGEAELVPELDGCGAPTYRLPLRALAHAFSRLANPEGLSAVRAEACHRMLHAIRSAPAFLAGRGRLTTELVAALPGRIFPKNGAEGVYALGVPGLGLGLAVKIDDGNERGYFPVVIAALRRFAVLGEVPPSLADFAAVPVFNTQKKLVGAVESAVPW
jgi:L-asparaginase II